MESVQQQMAADVEAADAADAETTTTSRDMQCPVCGEELQSYGESVRAYGEASNDPVMFGDILSLECGHRLHRSCMLAWLNQAPEPSCPMCRKVTTWQPSVDERTNLRAIVQQGWKTLETSEQNWIMWTWIIAGIVSLTDPIGFVLVSGLIMAVTPPMFYPDMAIFLATIKRFLVSKAKPGQRIMVAVTAAVIITLYILTLHLAAT